MTETPKFKFDYCDTPTDKDAQNEFDLFLDIMNIFFIKTEEHNLDKNHMAMSLASNLILNTAANIAPQDLEMLREVCDSIKSILLDKAVSLGWK